MDNIKAFEIELHQPAIRKNASRVLELLHPEFIEIGYSGRTWDFKSTLTSIAELPSDFVIWSQNYQFVEYTRGVVQVIYLSARIDDKGELSRHAKRSSIWVEVAGVWKIKYHQATPIDTFEKIEVP